MTNNIDWERVFNGKEDNEMEKVIGRLMEKLLHLVSNANGNGSGTIELTIPEADILLAALAVYTVDSLIIKKAKATVNRCRFCGEIPEDCECSRGRKSEG